MAVDLSIKIGGEAGQGIQTVGSLLASACRNTGLYIMAINDFESRIRGGHSFFQIRISGGELYECLLSAGDIMGVGWIIVKSEDTFNKVCESLFF